MTKSKYLTDSYHSSSWFEPGGWQELALLGAAIKGQLFVALRGGAMDAKTLARKVEADERATQMILETLAELGYVNESATDYTLTDVASERFGDPESSEYLGWAVLHSWRLVERWLTLPEVLKTGAPVPGDRFSETIEGFIRAMDVYAAPTAEEVAGICLEMRPQAATALDIGGATGTVSKVLAARGLRPTLFDLPEAIEVIREETAKAFPDITLVGGDFNVALPDGPFDIAFLGNVAHIYSPDKNQALFQRVADNLEPGGLIAILDFVRGTGTSAAFFGLNMLVNTTAGGTWTKEQYEDWLTGAGFKDVEIRNLGARDQQLILARL